jgi:Flavodoxin domain
MNAVVVYESVYGNTRAIAEAIAEGLGGATVASVHDAGSAAGAAELLVVGGPTHIHGLATSRSRKMAVDAAQEDGHAVEPDAAADPGLRRWLSELPKVDGVRAAAFDTRLDRSAAMTGAAARGIGRRLRHRGYEVIARESFLVEDSEGPLEEGELGRARAWGAGLAEQLAGVGVA